MDKKPEKTIKDKASLFGLADATILPGMIVKIKDPQNNNEQGHYRVRKVTKNTVNLGSIFGRHLYFKGFDKSRVKEDEAEWYKGWQQSESYQCM